MVQSSRFDSAALTWDEKPMRVKIAQDVAEGVLHNLPIDDEMTLLDYGCGTGLVALFLQPYVKQVIGIDSSQGMLAAMEQKVKKLGLSNVEIRYGDLAKEEGLEEESVDLIVTSMTMHHIQDVGHLFKKFYSALRSGGYLAVADLDQEDGTFHTHGNEGVAHFGFDRALMRQWFEDAGLIDVRDVTVHEVKKENGRTYPIFLMTGRKA
ncbi:MAG: class I SAM-dependent methyltransferase [Campylobacterales bacterium]